MKFNIGDKVRLTRKWILFHLRHINTTEEDWLELAKRLINWFEICQRDIGLVYADENGYCVKEEYLKLVERKDEDNEMSFKKVQVSNDKINWRRLWYIWMNKNNEEYPYICARKIENNTLFIEWMLIDITHWKYIREDYKYLSRKEIAEEFGVDEDFILTD